MKYETANFHVDLHQTRLFKLENLVSALSAQIASLQSVANQAVATETALKAKLDAAVTANVAQAATLATVQAELVTAQANASDPADAAAIAAIIQSLTDANTVNAPGN
jgi:hypothetical protein